MNTVNYMACNMIEAHRELVEEGKYHNDTYDSFVDDDSNWIMDDDEGRQTKTGDLANRHEFLHKLCSGQREAIAKSHAAFSKFASDYEDMSPMLDRKAEAKIAAFFAEFGI